MRMKGLKEVIIISLLLVWEIAALHGGTVQIERSGADGTVMLVTLPRDGKES